MILGFKLGFLEITIVDIIDVTLVTILLSQAYKLIRGSLAIRVFLGFIFLYLLFLVVDAAGMELVTTILGQFMGVGVLAVIILFQQEIRKFLLLVGRTTALDDGQLVKNIKGIWSPDKRAIRSDVTSIVDAAKVLSGSETGALIVLSRNSELKFYADSGDRMEAVISKRLLLSIFNKFSPLHDGAVIIYRNKIVAARCILPVTERDDIPAQFGLRHRAAIGMSEITDTLLIVVSEETGQISIVKQGSFMENLTAKELRSEINQYLMEDTGRRNGRNNPDNTTNTKDNPSNEESPKIEEIAPIG
ncbi:MAG: diadenylate cyclase CdaA [Cytophagales bacterium]|nr:diadenylate cyclase CdaA [Cytophagales bacterium]